MELSIAEISEREQVETVAQLCKTNNVQEFLKVPKEFIFKYGEYFFKCACLCGKLNIVKIILNLYEPEVYCDIHSACESGNFELVEFLLKYYDERYTIIMYEACRQMNISYIEKLVIRKTTNMRNAISQAAHCGYVGIVKLFIDRGVSY